MLADPGLMKPRCLGFDISCLFPIGYNLFASEEWLKYSSLPRMVLTVYVDCTLAALSNTASLPTHWLVADKEAQHPHWLVTSTC